MLCMIHASRPHQLAVPAISYLDVWRLWRRLTTAQRTELVERARRYRVERAVTAVLQLTEHLAAGTSARPDLGPGSQVLPSTDDALRGTRPPRLRQIAQKLLLTEGPRETLGLGYAWVAAIVNGWSGALRNSTTASLKLSGSCHITKWLVSLNTMSAPFGISLRHFLDLRGTMISS